MKKADGHANTQINDDTANNDAYDSLDGTFVDLVNYLVVVFYKPYNKMSVLLERFMVSVKYIT